MHDSRGDEGGRGEGRGRAQLREVVVDVVFVGVALEVVAGDEVLDALLDRARIRTEQRHQLLRDL